MIRGSGLAGGTAAFAQLEETNGGRLGIAVPDTATAERSGYRADERFPMCSTFKFLLASPKVREPLDWLSAVYLDVQMPAAMTIELRVLQTHAGLSRSDTLVQLFCLSSSG
jgi:hypothetical protein